MNTANGLSVIMLEASALYRKAGADKVLYSEKITSGAVMFVAAGHAGIVVNPDNHIISPNDILTLVRGGTLTVNYCSDDFCAYLITFSSDFVRDADLLRNMMSAYGTMARNPILKAENGSNAEIIGQYCSAIRETFRARGLTFREEIMKNIFEALLFAINGLYNDKFGATGRGRGRGDNKSSRSDDLLKRFMTLVAENYAWDREISFYAGELCVTPKHLTHAVKTASGELPSALISQAVIMDAKGKLKSTGMSVGEISDSLNFPNPSFFCKYFRKHTGITPKKYRDASVRIPLGEEMLNS